jgi:hypothetical protein
MRPSRNTPFKDPRLFPSPVDVPIGRGHRKDNSEWGKRIEKELAQIERRKESELQKRKQIQKTDTVL